MARIIPYAAIQFCSHEQWKRILHVDTGTTSDKLVRCRNRATNQFILKIIPFELLLFFHLSRKSNVRRFLAGSLAGVTSQSLTYPLDLARARMAVTQKEQYNTLREVINNLIKYLINNSINQLSN
jgi:solute carrier family 25 protein 42